MGLGRALVKNRLVRNFGPFLPILLVWLVVVRVRDFPPSMFVGPDAVLQSFGDLIYKGILPGYLTDSLMRLVSGIFYSLLLGLPLGFLIGLNRYVRRFSWPLLLFFQAIGDIAWLPLLIVWDGFGLTTVTWVIVYTAVFPLMVNIVAGIDGVPEDLVRAARSLGARPGGVIWEVMVPGALPAVVTGIRTGLGYGWRALIAAEIIVGTSGIGFMSSTRARGARVTEVFVGMIVLGALWYATDTLILLPLEHGTIERWGMVRSADAEVAR
ncbi:MAG: ABC transporter permease subunit [Chloroflexi bacterium]|nr:ABC transporter permease subunit [Chloroflexota bacterium]